MFTTRADGAPALSEEGAAAEPQDAGAWVTQDEAALLSNCSYDTIRRYRGRAGGRTERLRSRKRSDGVIEVSVVDLVACGLLDPLVAREDVAGLATRGRAERDLASARQELAVLGARLEAMTARAERAEHDVRALHQLLGASLRGN